MVGKGTVPHVLVCVDGKGDLEYNGDFYSLKKGDVMFLPASVGACPFVPKGEITCSNWLCQNNFKSIGLIKFIRSLFELNDK